MLFRASVAEARSSTIFYTPSRISIGFGAL